MKPKQLLIRLVRNNNEVLPDFSCKMPGRGTYICKNIECIKKAKKLKRLEKIFSQKINDNIFDILNKKVNNNFDGGENID